MRITVKVLRWSGTVLSTHEDFVALGVSDETQCQVGLTRSIHRGLWLRYTRMLGLGDQVAVEVKRFNSLLS